MRQTINTWVSEQTEDEITDLVPLVETGVEAAAATAVDIGRSAIPPMDVRFDHPFVISIVDPEQTILFLGHVVDPTQGN